MTARQEALEATAERICAATIELWLATPYDEMTLDRIAERSGVTRQTILRHYGSKEKLVLAATAWYAPQLAAAAQVEPGDVDGAVGAIVSQYETMGDANIRMLEVEDRIDAVREVLETGRAQHRTWVEETFAPQLKAVPSRDRTQVVDALYAATDVTVWKLWRREFGRSRASTRRIMHRLVRGVLSTLSEQPRGESS